MQIIRSVNEMQEMVLSLRKENKTIGFVPTMGFFHEGHLSLMEQANKDNDIVITSIFVNPLQFGPSEDYEQYPRDEESDIKQAEKTGVDIVFIPDTRQMYPKKMTIALDVTDRVHVLCGRSRPGHFQGVVTVLAKLFNIVQPNKVYFGRKDAQQAAVVDALINDLNFPIELVALPTVREKDGLAKSSRNVNLRNAEREEAPWIYKALEQGRQLVVDGEKNPDIVVKEVLDTIDNHTNGKIDYVELLSYPELQTVSAIDQQVILASAVYFNEARLIDNLLFDQNGKIVKRIEK
ncbi:pantoate--beta-alanine ligase [Virgibacillus phasianinus]|uniref:Pantothenate synthetase n=1 Tax=Virgibacillus phasianinus TaxID=2017483 RepID=A0A220U5C0_9BACI|nr:pantoate--beta-alanine ligase [Virgibacillus phasianinus]ASK63358.1 pantoate--beta-alanine ligase [Virgibacillus phasianinus]